jgi:hypothetical protein
LEQVAQGYRIRQNTHASRGRDSVTEITSTERERERERERCVGRSGAFLLRDCNMISAMAANGALRCPDIICCSSSLQSSADPSLLFSLERKKLTSCTFMKERINPSRRPQEATKKVHTAATPSTLSFKRLRKKNLQQEKAQQKLCDRKVYRLRRKFTNTAETNRYSNQQY